MDKNTTLYIVILSITLVLAIFLMEGRIGLGFADEGFLWYGSERTLAGEVPLRDFQSYFPGRYYWTAAWMKIFGTGILNLRTFNAIFQCLGLIMGLMVAKRVLSSRTELCLMGILLAVWMFPRHKLFEPSLAMAAIYFAVLILEEASVRRVFVGGLFCGIAAFFGKNHGLYCAAAFVSLIVVIRIKNPTVSFPKLLMAWLLGTVLGFSPVIFMIIVIPGFFDAFIDSIFVNFKYGTNLTLPVPWPWVVFSYAVKMMEVHFFIGLNQLFGALCFLFMPIFYLSTIAAALISNAAFLRRTSVLVASSVLGIFYMHHAFSRADIGHLAQAIHPFLIGLVAIPHAYQFENNRILRILVVFFMCAAILSGLSGHEYYQNLRVRNTAHEFQWCRIRSDSLLIDPQQALIVDALGTIIRHDSDAEEDFCSFPLFPSFYSILNKKSPIWELFLTLPPVDDRQQKIIKRLEEKRVKTTLIIDHALDGRDELRFCNSHPLIWEYVVKEHERLSTGALPENYKVFVKRR